MSERVATDTRPVEEMCRECKASVNPRPVNDSSSTEEYSHWEGDTVWRKSLSRRSVMIVVMMRLVDL